MVDGREKPNAGFNFGERQDKQKFDERTLET